MKTQLYLLNCLVVMANLESISNWLRNVCFFLKAEKGEKANEVNGNGHDVVAAFHRDIYQRSLPPSVKKNDVVEETENVVDYTSELFTAENGDTMCVCVATKRLDTGSDTFWRNQRCGFPSHDGKGEVGSSP